MQMQQQQPFEQQPTQQQQLQSICILDVDGNEITDPFILSEMMKLNSGAISEN